MTCLPEYTNPACKPEDGNSWGFRYRDLKQLYKGYLWNLAEVILINNNVFPKIAEKIAGTTSCFYLSQQAVNNPADFRVTVDGSQIVNDSNTGWIYDVNFNAVCFQGIYSPPIGSNLTVSYPI